MLPSSFLFIFTAFPSRFLCLVACVSWNVDASNSLVCGKVRAFFLLHILIDALLCTCRENILEWQQVSLLVQAAVGIGRGCPIGMLVSHTSFVFTVVSPAGYDHRLCQVI